MIYLTLFYLLLAAFIIWVWSPPTILRMIIQLVLLLLYSLIITRLKREAKK